MTFYWTPVSLTFSVITMIVAAVCCCVSWNRSGFNRSTGLLEVFRLLLIGLVVFSLNQPEITETVPPDAQSVLVVLHDQSGSMETRDVLSQKSLVSAGLPMTRADAVEPLLVDDLWSPLKKNMKLIFEPFSSDLAVSTAGTDLDSALTSVLDRHTGLRAVVLLSDGDWNTGNSPSSAATDLRIQNIPVFCVGMGSEDRLPDIELTSSSAPTFGLPGKTVRIPFRVMNWLPRDQVIVVSVNGTGTDVVEKTVRVSGMGQLNDTVEWKPEKTGDYELTVSIPVIAEETIAENNEVNLPINIRNEALQVLIVESYPRWEYRYLRNALERDPGVQVNCLLFHPGLDGVGGGRGYLKQFPGDTELFKYDVVFLGDVGVSTNQLTQEDCENIRQLVRSHAGGLVFLPGFRGQQKTLLTTELNELYPVVPDVTQPQGVGIMEPARFSLTESGRRSLLTRLEADNERNEEIWRSLPGFQWYAATARARIGTDVLVTHDSESTRFGRIPLIATRTSGTGKVLFMGTDGAWRWRKGVEDLYHYRFWGQVVRWMAYQRNMSAGESMRLFYLPDRPEADNVLTLNANVMKSTGEPLRDGTVAVQIVAPSGQIESVRLSSAGDDSWGLFSGSFTPKEGGEYELISTCTETGARLETSISIQGRERERVGQPARFDVLKEISEISRGRLTTVSGVEELVGQLSALPEPELITRRVRIWSHPAWGGVLILLLGCFWSARKLAGLA
ncbi:MAG: VWA domain-containing protein [Fuerstiella sp.]|nr:VWA domain-containing protein [Fuerstiella sp.]